MKNHIQLNEEKRAFVSTLTWVTDIRHTQITRFFWDPRRPGQLAQEPVLQGTIGLCVMLASEI